MAKKRNKKGIALETLTYWLIAIGVLVVMVIIYMILARKGGGGISFIDRLFNRPVG